MREFDLLVVDDDMRYLKMIKSLFEHEGLKVLCVDSGEEALRMMKEKPIGLIFTDYHMPGMNGVELAGKIREVIPEARMIMTTSDSSPEVTALAMKAGISKVTPKPCKLKEIQDIISEEKQWLIDSLREAVSTQGKEV
ncbi:MAG: response regulator [Deltaproteobacteria bacterium]